MSALAALDTSVPQVPEPPTSLPLAGIHAFPALFQPRHGSLVLRRHASKAHVGKMVRVLRSGQHLDPLSVVSFGDRWYLIDGHHRLKAYHDHGKLSRVPVVASMSDKRGTERVHWAIALSVAANVKDKLSMTGSDKFDAAWRLTVLGSSKSATMAASGVADGTIAKMRRVRKDILEAAKANPSLLEVGTQDYLYGISWREAQDTLRRLMDGSMTDLDDDSNWREMNMRRLVKSLTGVFTDNTDLSVLMDALEAMRPGVTDELQSFLNEESTFQDDLAALDI